MEMVLRPLLALGPHVGHVCSGYWACRQRSGFFLCLRLRRLYSSGSVTAPHTGLAEVLQRLGRFLRFCVDENFQKWSLRGQSPLGKAAFQCGDTRNNSATVSKKCLSLFFNDTTASPWEETEPLETFRKLHECSRKPSHPTEKRPPIESSVFDLKCLYFVFT